MRTRKVFIVIILGFIVQSSFGQQFTDLHGDYLGQTPPGDTPVVFAPGIISKDGLLDGGPFFTPDGNEVAWRENQKTGPNNTEWIFLSWNMRREDGVWSAPYRAPFDGDSQMLYSADGQSVYLSLTRSDTLDIWFAERLGDNWGEPKCLEFISRWPELKFAWVLSITSNGALYLTCSAPGLYDNAGIYRTELVNSEYIKPMLLPRNINLPPFLNWTPFIAADESYLLFSSTRTGSGDLFISFQKIDGSWTDPVSLGERINTEEMERYPIVSPDGKYLFFTRGHDMVHNVYWVSTHILVGLKKAAYAPKLSKQIPAMNIKTDSVINYVIPASTFSCEYSVDSLKYTATLSNGAALPSWLSFNAETRTLSGTSKQAGTDTIKISVTNKDTVSASCTFKIKVTSKVGISQLDENKIKISPNPTTGLINISFGANQFQQAIAEVFNTEGKLLLAKTFRDTVNETINLSYFPKGMYVLNLNIDGEIFNQKICFN